MRRQALPEADRVQMDADPDWADRWLGPEPDLLPLDARVWSTYWTMRNAAPSGFAGPTPVDLIAALDLYERIHGNTDPRRLSEKFAAMDRAFLTHLPKKKNEGK